MTEYAIQINGFWGSGKTFYVKNKLFKAIDELYEGNKKKYKICYISLNGIARVGEIGESVFFEMADVKNKLGVQGIKLLANYGPGLTTFLGPWQGITNKGITSTTKQIEKFLKKPDKSRDEDVIIFIDDLERKSEKITIAEVFGYIYTNYLENQLAKVIFITNESEITDEQKYYKSKEKIINKSLVFEQNSYDIIKEIVYHTFGEDRDFMDFIHQNEDDVFEVINTVFPTLNLRTIRYALDNFNIVFHYSKKVISPAHHFSYAMKFLLVNILIVSKEYKEADVMKAPDFSDMYGHRIYYFKHFKTNNFYIKELVEKYSDKSRFINKYKYFFETITGLIVDGYLNNEEFKKEILEFLDIKKQNIHSDDGLEPIQIITNYRFYTESKVREAQEMIEKSLKENEFNPTEYPNLYREFLYMQKMNLIFLKSDINQLFSQSFFRAIEGWQPKENESIHEKDTDKNPLLQKMIDELNNQISNYRDARREEVVEEWLQKLVKEENDEELFKKVEYERELFHILNKIESVEKYVSKNRKVPIRLQTMFYHKYLKSSGLSLDSLTELKNLKTLIEQLQKLCKNGSIDKIHIHNIEVLVKNMEEIALLEVDSI